MLLLIVCFLFHEIVRIKANEFSFLYVAKMLGIVVLVGEKKKPFIHADLEN